jgi:hypothetical protein
MRVEFCENGAADGCAVFVLDAEVKMLLQWLRCCVPPALD